MARQIRRYEDGTRVSHWIVAMPVGRPLVSDPVPLESAA